MAKFVEHINVTSDGYLIPVFDSTIINTKYRIRQRSRTFGDGYTIELYHDDTGIQARIELKGLTLEGTILGSNYREDRRILHEFYKQCGFETPKSLNDFVRTTNPSEPCPDPDFGKPLNEIF